MQANFLSMILVLSLSLSAPAPAPTTKSDLEYYQKSGHRAPKWDPLVEAGFKALEGANFEPALRFLKQAINFGCNDSLVFFKLALYAEKQGDLVQTVELLKKIEPDLKKRYPKHPSTLTLADHMAGLYYTMNRYDEALAKFLEAIEANGEDFMRTFLSAQIYRMKGDPANAIVYFEKSLQYEPPAMAPGMKEVAKVELQKLYEAVKKTKPKN